MGYTGAVFKQFLGAGPGLLLALGSLLLWLLLPAAGIWHIATRRDF
jgi:hypothetical protein